LATPFAGLLAVHCPFLVQGCQHVRLKPLRLRSFLAFVQMLVGLVEQRAAVAMFEPLRYHRRGHASTGHERCRRVSEHVEGEALEHRLTAVACVRIVLDRSFYRAQPDAIAEAGETYKSAVKMTFAKRASLKDPSGLFNSSLEGNVRRAIDFHEGDKIDETAFRALIRSAVALNTSRSA
jgi:Domain of unknown function (DU1801)